ncbi:response regulator transcription factor [Cohnella cholangitidis]|uniref:Response regulator n=1 Tax=Cohnella cholangitidis TaxID=2598458 RepID=A0A7G5C1U2_9BACL|nr:response regulator [Cohnella cholangitidis]QMV43176.1 response regulator [Cohnella cholangitidis]
MQQVMIVEDDVMYRYAIRSSMEWEKEGFRICAEAINGKHALTLLQDCRPDIVITDINMPEMNGIDLIAELQEHHPFIKIIVLSSYDDFPFVKQALKSGAKDYLLKHELEPGELADLMKRLKEDSAEYEHSPETKNGAEIPVKGTTHREVQQLMDYIKSHYREPITLQQLSNHLFLSPNYLCSLFKQETGITIVDYIKQFRIEMAKQLLESSHLKVYEIAESVGFTSSSYLCRVFKEMTGFNINEYKRTMH